MISFSCGGTILRQAYEQHKPVDKTDFGAGAGGGVEWQEQGTEVRPQLSLPTSPVSEISTELAQVVRFDPSGCYNSA